MVAGSNGRRWAGTTLAVVTLISVGRGPAEASAFTPRDLRAARVVWATIAGKLMEGDPGSALVKRVRDLCEEKDAYCFDSLVEETDGGSIAKVKWLCKLDFGAEYKPLKELPIPDESERAKQGYRGKDSETGALIFYQENRKKRKPVSRVRFKKVYKGVLLSFGVIREIHESPEDAVRKATPRWRLFHKAAEFYQIANRDTLDITALAGDKEGQLLENGDVVTLDVDAQTRLALPLEIHAESPDVPTDKPYEIYFDIQKEHRKVVLLSKGKGVSSLRRTLAGDTVTANAPDVNVSLLFSKDARKKLKDEPVPVTIRFAGTSKQIFVQLADWQPVITRFEVIQQPGESIRLSRGVSQIESLGIRGQFNERRKVIGHLLDAWRELEPLAKTRPYGLNPGQGVRPFRADEPVLMAWGLDRETGHSFLTAEDTSRQPNTGIYLVRAHQQVEFDVWIVRDLKPAARRADPDDDGFGIDEEAQVHMGSRQRKLREQYEVSEFELSVHPVVQPTASEEDSPEDWDIRQQAGEAKLLRRGRPLVEWSTFSLDDYTNLDPIRKTTAQPVMFQFTDPGIYELRLRLTMRHIKYRRPKTVDVAIRVRVAKPGFRSERIWSQTERRGSPRRGSAEQPD